MGKTKKRLTIGIYSPYFEILGGGERYLLAIAEFLSKEENVFLHASPEIKEKAKKMFHIDLRNVSFMPSGEFRLPSYDVFFYMTDGSIFFPKGKKNFLMVQSPAHCPPNSFLNKLKLRKWHILCYSKFMQSIIKTRLGRTSTIFSPPINTDIFNVLESEKENIILTVGRFFSHLHNKKQGVLLEQFKKHHKQYFLNWKLIIAGGLTDKGGEGIVKKLSKVSKGFPIQIVVNPSFTRLVELYKRAKIYWHATGFGEDLAQFPEKAEHFGITTLEAMAAGNVPIVFNGGGQRDIVSDGKNGFLWEKQEELIEKTRELIDNDVLCLKIARQATKRAADFSLKHFYEKLETLIKN